MAHMVVFRCRRCHSDVTAPVREVPLPDEGSRPKTAGGSHSPARLVLGARSVIPIAPPPLRPWAATAPLSGHFAAADKTRNTRRKMWS